MRGLSGFFKTALIIPVFFFLLTPSYGAGTVTGDFLLVNVSARETALGGVYAANYAKPGASTANPAVLYGIRKQHVLFSHYSSVFGTYYEQLIYATPIGKRSAIAGQFLFSTTAGLHITDENGNPVGGEVDNYDALIGAVYSLEISKGFSFGVNMKIITSKILDNANWGAAINLGLLYRNFDNRYMIGVSVENLGLSVYYFTDGLMYPLFLRAGYATEVYRYESSYQISVYIEERIAVNEEQGAETSFGLEAVYENFFVFRYGYIFGREEGRVSVGAGIRLKQFDIDYAFQPFFVSDNVHRITLELVF